MHEAKVHSEPDALNAWFGEPGVAMERIGLEAGPLSQWLHAGMAGVGLAVELIETRHVRAAFKTMPVKADKKDARGIAQLMRLGWFRPVHCKSVAALTVNFGAGDRTNFRLIKQSNSFHSWPRAAPAPVIVLVHGEAEEVEERRPVYKNRVICWRPTATRFYLREKGPAHVRWRITIALPCSST